MSLQALQTLHSGRATQQVRRNASSVSCCLSFACSVDKVLIMPLIMLCVCLDPRAVLLVPLSSACCCTPALSRLASHMACLVQHHDAMESLSVSRLCCLSCVSYLRHGDHDSSCCFAAQVSGHTCEPGKQPVRAGLSITGFQGTGEPSAAAVT
jgi:hypothetical protein